jgi:hypothetical protein
MVGVSIVSTMNGGGSVGSFLVDLPFNYLAICHLIYFIREKEMTHFGERYWKGLS